MTTTKENMKAALSEITQHIEGGILPFWTTNGIDHEYGGYLTCFDDDGLPGGDTDKYLVTQTRMIWGMSAFFREYPERQDLRDAAKQGVHFFIRHFWDSEHGGWFWRVTRTGQMKDSGKVIYGQSFAIYCLAEYTLATGDPIGLEYAAKTFDLLQKYAVDTENGGYYENLEPDWSLSEPGFAGGDIKSLNIHMHLLEAFTTLYDCSKLEIHRRRLIEIIHLIIDKMIDPATGCGLIQFDLRLQPKPAVQIRRTWDSESATDEIPAIPTDVTSFGHNVELAWLLTLAVKTLGQSVEDYHSVIRRLVDHAIDYGLDKELGGIYRDGTLSGKVVVDTKEWWQNSEVLVGFLDAYELFEQDRYYDAFEKTWKFDRTYFINHEVGEWRQLLDRRGAVLNGSIGNPWKAIYHTGRSMLECKKRLRALIGE